jgi:hypothetical protein
MKNKIEKAIRAAAALTLLLSLAVKCQAQNMDIYRSLDQTVYVYSEDGCVDTYHLRDTVYVFFQDYDIFSSVFMDKKIPEILCLNDKTVLYASKGAWSVEGKSVYVKVGTKQKVVFNLTVKM